MTSVLNWSFSISHFLFSNHRVVLLHSSLLFPNKQSTFPSKRELPRSSWPHETKRHLPANAAKWLFANLLSKSIRRYLAFDSKWFEQKRFDWGDSGTFWKHRSVPPAIPIPSDEAAWTSQTNSSPDLHPLSSKTNPSAKRMRQYPNESWWSWSSDDYRHPKFDKLHRYNLQLIEFRSHSTIKREQVH